MTARLLSNVKVDLDNFIPTFSFQVALLLDQIVSQTTNNTGQNVTLCIPLVCNGDVKWIEMVPDWIHSQVSLSERFHA